MIEASDDNFSAEVLEAKIPVLVDFWAPWCGPCQTLGPMIEVIAEKTSGHAKVVKINIDENPETASKFDVRSIPTVAIFRDGEEVERFVGVQHPRLYLEALGFEVDEG